MIFLKYLLRVLLSHTLLLTGDDEYHIVAKTAHGLVKGIIDTQRGVKVATFLGVPYAKPPLDSKRFSRPERIDRWNRTYDATRFKPGCITVHKQNPHSESEDCLYVNIWAPIDERPELYPIIFYIHGGGYMDGSPRIPGSIFSSLSRTVVVSVQYRLSVFGFLNLHIEEAPGNMGLLDQQLALEWVNMNIEAFGGNSREITIMGISAGAASVGYHLLSPKSQNLFQRAVMHSGSPMDPWAFDSRRAMMVKSKELAGLTGCGSSNLTKNPKRFVKCLQTLPADVLNSKTAEIRTRPLFYPFVPSFDNFFITGTPIELIRQGKFKKTEVIIGTDKNDGGSLFLSYFPKFFKHGFPSGSEIQNVTRIMNPELSDDQFSKVMEKYQLRVFESQKRNAIRAGHMIGDRAFLCPSLSFAESISKFGGKAFYYQFDHKKIGSTSWVDVPHGADKMYILGKVQTASGYTHSEKKLSERMLNQWVEFIKQGVVKSQEFTWPVYSERNRTYYRIETGQPRTSNGPRNEYCSFWENL